MGRYALLGLWGFPTLPHWRATQRAMERLEVADLAGRHLLELSAGQRQRVFVAQGLVQEADLLLLDEPFTGLDLVSTERIRSAVAEERQRGVTIVMTTHDVAEANRADHVLLMAGRVHAEGPPLSALHPDRLSEAYGDRHHAPGRRLPGARRRPPSGPAAERHVPLRAQALSKVLPPPALSRRGRRAAPRGAGRRGTSA